MCIYCSRLCRIFEICLNLKFTFDFLNKNHIVTVFFLYSVIFGKYIYMIYYFIMCHSNMQKIEKNEIIAT